MFENIFKTKTNLMFRTTSKNPYPDTNCLIEPVPYYIITISRGTIYLAFLAGRLRFKSCIHRNSADSGSKQYHHISQKD